MNLNNIVSDEQYHLCRKSDWPTYESIIRGDIGSDSSIQQQILKLFNDSYDQYCAQLRGADIAQGNQQSQQQVFHDKHINFYGHCQVPWQTLGINSYGDAFICLSPAWIPKFVGNVNAVDDIFSLLNSDIARGIRNEILQGRYYYCNLDICSFASSSLRYKSGKYQPTESDSVALDVSDDARLWIDQIPRNLIFDFDHTCNFRCPSCRTAVINNNKHPVIRKINDRIADKIKKLVIDKIQQQPIEIRWAGGELFISQVYLDLIEYILDQNKPNIRHIVQTNASYLISKSSLMEKLLPHIKELRISFDAATADTYHRIRINGQWDHLLDNVRWVTELNARHGNPCLISADFVVQKFNFQEIPAFKKLCDTLGITRINYQKMWNWNTWPDEIFADMNIWHEKHANFSQVSDLINIARRLK